MEISFSWVQMRITARAARKGPRQVHRRLCKLLKNSLTPEVTECWACPRGGEPQLSPSPWTDKQGSQCQDHDPQHLVGQHGQLMVPEKSLLAQPAMGSVAPPQPPLVETRQDSPPARVAVLLLPGGLARPVLARVTPGHFLSQFLVCLLPSGELFRILLMKPSGSWPQSR